MACMELALACFRLALYARSGHNCLSFVAEDVNRRDVGLKLCTGVDSRGLLMLNISENLGKPIV